MLVSVLIGTYLDTACSQRSGNTECQNDSAIEEVFIRVESCAFNVGFLHCNWHINVQRDNINFFQNLHLLSFDYQCVVKVIALYKPADINQWNPISSLILSHQIIQKLGL